MGQLKKVEKRQVDAGTASRAGVVAGLGLARNVRPRLTPVSLAQSLSDRTEAI
jgi:hypothetical protein